MNIQGHAALVTGGGSGLGEATARELARLGAKVAVLDLNIENAQRVAADIGGVAVQCNVSDEASMQAAIEAAAAAHGPARILMQIAGIGSAKRVVGKDGNAAPLADFARVINVNLIGTYNAARLFAAACAKLEPMEDGERGVMVFTALRLPGGPAGLQRVQGRRGRHDAAHGARPGAARHPRLHHRPRPVRHAADEGAARAGAGVAGQEHSLPQPPGQAGRIRAAGGAHREQRPPQRRSDSPGRRSQNGPPLISKVVVYEVEVMFGDCDPAGIVFFPNFSKWMDASSLNFFVKCGVPPWRELQKTTGIIGTPLLEIHTKFFRPATYGERLQIHTSVTEWREKVLIHKHLVKRGDDLLCEGEETRAFCMRDPANPDRIKAIPIPPDIRALCT